MIDASRVQPLLAKMKRVLKSLINYFGGLGLMKSTEPDEGKNKTPLQDYLEYYRQLTKPGYAILVTGAWGTGKTFQVKNCIPEKERYYVSLFGIQTVEQIHVEVLAAAFPTLERVNLTAEKMKDLGGNFALVGVVPWLANAVFSQKLDTDCTLIFDDLERSRISIKDLLGAINYYVE